MTNGTTILFKDDLEKIINLFEKDHKDAEIIIDEYKLENSSDIDKITKSHVTNFSVEVFQYYSQETSHRAEMLRLELMQFQARLTVSDENDTVLRGLASQISSILSPRRSKLHFLTSIPIVYIVGAMLFILVDLILVSPWSFSKQPVLSILLILLIILIIVLAIIWIVMTDRIRTQKYVVIYLMTSNARSNFFSRNKDELSKMIFGAVIGSVVTLIVGGIVYLINLLVHLIH